MPLASDELVLVESDEQILWVTLNRPDVRNAVDAAMAGQVADALVEADRRDDIRVVVVTGAGSHAFSAGGDLKALGRGESLEPSGVETGSWGFGGIARHRCSKPLIAAVNGSALGGGLEIVLACDLAVAASHATFGLPEVRHGLIAGAGGVLRLPRQIPVKIALEMLLTGCSINAERALALGLVNAVAAAADLRQATRDLALMIARNGPLAVQATLQIAREASSRAADDEIELWDRLVARSRSIGLSDDAAEGMKAFIDRRAPVWRGS